MGDARKDALRVEFDGRIKLEFHGATVTSDAGFVAKMPVRKGLAGVVGWRRNSCQPQGCWLESSRGV